MYPLAKLKCIYLPVREVDLPDDINEVEYLAEEEPKSVKVMVVEVEAEVVNQHGLAVPLHFVVQDR